MKSRTAEWSAVTSLDSDLLASRYETLRRAGLGESLPPDARSGLALLLGRGIWGWARALTIDTPRDLSRPSSAHAALGPQQEQSVIQVFASMALGLNKETAR
jgi:hypothetical protein